MCHGMKVADGWELTRGGSVEELGVVAQVGSFVFKASFDVCFGLVELLAEGFFVFGGFHEVLEGGVEESFFAEVFDAEVFELV